MSSVISTDRLRLSSDHLRHLRTAAAGAYPRECCGLIVGRADSAGEVLVTRLVATANIDPHPEDGFELDPAAHFALQRELRAANNGETLLGHYHSHPDAPPLPSARDLTEANDPGLIWLIIAIAKDRPGAVAAWRIDPDAPPGPSAMPVAIVGVTAMEGGKDAEKP